MESMKITDGCSSITTDVPTDDSPLYLFGPELYCGWCLKTFTCPVHLKIHFHMEHIATCSCGEAFSDKRSLSKHIVNSGCCLPAPFQWSHFITLPQSHTDVNQIHITDTSDDCEKSHSIEKRDTSSGDASDTCEESAESNANASMQKHNSKFIHKQEYYCKKYRCKFCPFSSNYRTSISRHVLAMHKNHVVAFKQNGSYPPFADLFYELSHASKRRVFCCKFCPYSSSSKYRANMMYHVLRKHKNVRSWFNCFTDSSLQSPPACISSGTVRGSNDQDFAKDSKSSESANVALTADVVSKVVNKVPAATEDHVKDGQMPSFGQQECCESHQISDIQFIVSCFSSSSGSKQLYCDLCNKEFAEWDQAAVHVYVAHCTALQQWRQAQSEADTSNEQPLMDIAATKQSPDEGQKEQLQNSCSAEHNVVPFSDDDACTHTTEVNMTVDIEHSFAGDLTAVDASNSQAPKNRVKLTLTADESKVLMSSLCRILNCCPPTQTCKSKDTETVNVHNAAVEDVSPRASQKLTSIFESKSITGAFNESMQQMSSNCKYCQRVCSSRYNCSKHEAACPVRLSSGTLVSQGGTLLQIRGTDIYYCSRCGFSDSDPTVVNAHLVKPDVHRGVKKLFVKPEPGHDFIGSMRTLDGAFKCNFCSANPACRSKILQHLFTHSFVAFADEKHITVPPNSSAVGEVTKKHNTSGSCSRSCPKCCRSFNSVIAYLRHRAGCQAQRHRRGYKCHLISYCRLRADGRWQCRMCEFTAATVKQVYGHIRAKHEEVAKAAKPHVEVVKAEVQTAKPYVKDVCVETADGKWQCRLCQCCISHRSDLYKHVRAKHANDINPSLDLEPPRLKRLTQFCSKTASGVWQCQFCTCCRSDQRQLFQHIRTVHKKLVTVELPEMTAAPSSIPSSLPPAFVRNNSSKKSAFHSQRQKSRGGHLIRSCPKCHRKFFNESVYRSHMQACGKQYVYTFTEPVSNGMTRCLICSRVYSDRGHCAVHIRKKHLNSGASTSVSSDVTDIKTEV